MYIRRQVIRLKLLGLLDASSSAPAEIATGNPIGLLLLLTYNLEA